MMKRAVGVKDFAVKYLFFEFSLRHGGGVGNLLDNRLFVLLLWAGDAIMPWYSRLFVCWCMHVVVPF